jgi:hypothetical protein
MHFLSAAVLGLSLAAAGCGTSSPTMREVKGVSISGKLQQNGKVIKLKTEEVVSISFLLKGSSLEDQISAQADYNPEDGTFVVKGPTGQGIPPGKYSVGLTNDFTDGSGGANRFSDSFDAQESALTADVGPEEGQYFTIDISTKRVTKKK